MTAAAEFYRALGDFNVVGVQNSDGFQDRVHPKRHMGEAGIFGRNIHQDIIAVIVIIGVEHQVQLDIVGVLHHCNGVVAGFVDDREAEQFIERHGPVQIRHADANMVDGFNIHEFLLPAVF